MRRIRVHRTGPPEVMVLEEGEEPAPGPGQVLIQVKAAGVNPVDAYVRAGIYGYSPELPYTPGADASGIVEAVGTGVAGISAGQRVYAGRSISGSYAEKALFDQTQVFPLPEGIAFAQGACVAIPYATAYRALFQKARAQESERVLVHGASGGVGTAAVQIARAAGMTVIGTAGSKEGRRLVREQGADLAADHRAPGHFDEIVAFTRGRGVEVIIELLANENLAKDLKILAPGGRVVVIGSRGTVEVDPRDAMQRDAVILGMVLKNTPPAEFREIHARIREGLRQGTLKPVVGREFPLEQAAQAHRAVMTPPAHGQIVLVVSV